jgi:hypothetical protein
MTTRAQLDIAGCDTPDCGHDHSKLFIVGRCHQHAGVDVCYDKSDGCLHITCHKCDKPVATIKVAKQ